MREKYKNSCPLTDEIVSYLYDEIAGNAQEDFERHLVDCTVCTDEFAIVSESRYSMFEWKKEAFDPLATPEIVIPYGPAVTAVTWTARMKAWAESWRVPVAVAAAVAVCVAIAMFIVSSSDNNEQSGATKVAAPDAAKPSDLAVTTLPGQAEEPTLKAVARPLNPGGSSALQRKQAIKRHPTDAEEPVNNFAITPNRTTQVSKVPALAQYPDNDDNSLRLAELFDEVGG